MGEKDEARPLWSGLFPFARHAGKPSPRSAAPVAVRHNRLFTTSMNFITDIGFDT